MTTKYGERPGIEEQGAAGFTQGPWWTAGGDGCAVLAGDRQDPSIIACCTTGDWCDVEFESERAANARLIAQAPALLTALEGIANSLDAEVRRADGSGLHLAPLAEHARAVIAQARGVAK